MFSFSPESRSPQKRPVLNTDPASIYPDGDPYSDHVVNFPLQGFVRKTVLSVGSGSRVSTLEDTIGIKRGMIAIGDGYNTPRDVELVSSTGVILLSDNQVKEGSRFYFTEISEPGIYDINRWYYARNVTETDFQPGIALGGCVQPPSSDATGKVVFELYVDHVTENQVIMNMYNGGAAENVEATFLFLPGFPASISHEGSLDSSFPDWEPEGGGGEIL